MPMAVPCDHYPTLSPPCHRPVNRLSTCKKHDQFTPTGAESGMREMGAFPAQHGHSWGSCAPLPCLWWHHFVLSGWTTLSYEANLPSSKRKNIDWSLSYATYPHKRRAAASMFPPRASSQVSTFLPSSAFTSFSESCFAGKHFLRSSGVDSPTFSESSCEAYLAAIGVPTFPVRPTHPPAPPITKAAVAKLVTMGIQDLGFIRCCF